MLRRLMCACLGCRNCSITRAILCNAAYVCHVLLHFSVMLHTDAFYRAMLHRARYCYGTSSVCPSVTLGYCDHIGRNSSKIISQLVRLGHTLFADPNIMGLLQGEHPQILAQMGVGYGKSGSRHTKATISQKRLKIEPRQQWITNRK